MKTLFLVILFFLSIHLWGQSQDWVKINREKFNNELFISLTPNNKGKLFKINPADSSMWFSSDDKILRIANNGAYTEFGIDDFPTNTFGPSFTGIDFTETDVFALGENYGLYRYHNGMWSIVIPTSNGIYLHADRDTVWIVRMNNNLMRWKAGQTDQLPYANLRRIQVKNGNAWGSSSVNTSSICRFLNNTCPSILPSNSILPNYGNTDFKFSPFSDTLFIAFDGGFALAFGDEIVDTLTKHNTTNMPEGKIFEFEFDQNNNIWAMFGDNPVFYKPTHMAYLDRATKTWSNVYDATNSLLPFNEVYNLEIDPTGNVWVASLTDLYLLPLGGVPAWVSEVLSVDNKLHESKIEIYPNPTHSSVTIEINEPHAIVRVFDAHGKFIQENNIQSHATISIETLETGVYLFEISSGESKEVRRVIKL